MEHTMPGGNATEDRRFVSKGVSENYRSAAGLEPRKNDKSFDPAKTAELNKATEPEGGYGGKGGITNTAGINQTEEARQKKRAEGVEAAVKQSAKEQTETQEGIPMESAPGVREQAEKDGATTTTSKPAKKTAAKKTAAKKS